MPLTKLKRAEFGLNTLYFFFFSKFVEKTLVALRCFPSSRHKCEIHKPLQVGMNMYLCVKVHFCVSVSQRACVCVCVFVD